VNVEFRPASSLAPGRLAALFTRAYEDYVVPMQIDEETLRFLVRTFDLDLDAGRVALRDEEPVGLVNLGIRGERGWIGGLGVVAPARRDGVGRALMEAVHAEARARGVCRISLEVIEGNDAAYRLYEALGYETTRWLEIGSLDADGKSGLTDEQPWEQAHARIREQRSAPEPWQRDDDTLRHYDDLRGMCLDTGAAVFRVAGGRATLLQFAGDEAAAGAVLTSLRRAGPVNLFNVPAGDPVLRASEGLGGRTTLRQQEMVLSLTEAMRGLRLGLALIAALLFVLAGSAGIGSTATTLSIRVAGNTLADGQGHVPWRRGSSATTPWSTTSTTSPTTSRGVAGGTAARRPPGGGRQG
jgi:ribosomal protein S18 acetylase RimI-like enzyme